MTNLSQTRGDTAGYTFKRIDADGNTITTTPDALYFTLKKAYPAPPALLPPHLVSLPLASAFPLLFPLPSFSPPSLSFLPSFSLSLLHI